MLEQAKTHNHTRSGEVALLTHLTVWREYHAVNPKSYDTDALRLPLTHANGIDLSEAEGRAFDFLRDPNTPESLEPADADD